MLKSKISQAHERGHTWQVGAIIAYAVVAIALIKIILRST